MRDCDGQDWIVEDLGPTSFEHVWALNDDEVWVAGGPASEVVRRTGGMWNHVDLPQPFLYIAGLDGHAADRVVALTDSGLLWAYDGVDWSHLTSLDHDADGIALTDDGASLIVAGGDDRHAIWQVDVTDGSTELLHEREHIHVGTMIADSVDRALLSSQSPRMTWLVTDDTWERVYDAPPVDRGFAALLGPIDQAIGVRRNLYSPDAVWQLGEQPTALPDPIATGRFHDVIEFDGQLWVAGYEDTWTDRPLAHAWDGTDWTDHSPPLIGSNDSVEKLSAAGDRVYAWLPGTVTDHLMVLDGGDWQTLPLPPTQLDMTAYTDIAATASDRLWVTQTVVGSETLLWMWDGDTWHDALAMFPQLAGQCCWHRFGETGDGRLWLLSRGNGQTEQLAYYDGIDWVIVETPAELVGWRDARPQMAVAGDGLVVYDGMLVWQYASCPVE